MKRRNEFIEQANARFNYKFDYSKFEYVNAKTKSTIVCPIHGEFLQNPDKHLNGKYGCMACWGDRRVQVLTGIKRSPKPVQVTADEFKARVVEKYGDKFTLDLKDYSGVMGAKVKFTCPIHGEFEKQPHIFMISGFGCTECGMRSKDRQKQLGYDDFLVKANSKHQGAYSYPDENRTLYVDRKSILRIVCNKHGEYSKKAQKHLAGQGCFRCRIDKLIQDGILVGGYSQEVFDQNPGLGEQRGYLYYLKIGDYYKVGITKAINRRLAALRNKSQEDVVLIDSLETTLYEAWKLEQMMLTLNKKDRVYLDWSTELFSRDVLND